MVGKLLGVRLPDNIMAKFDLIASQNNESTNQLAKKALIEWIEVLFTSRNLNMIILPKSSLIRMLSFLPTNEMQDIATEIAQNIIEYFQFLFKTHISHFTDEMFYSIISKFLGSSGTMWFDHLEFGLQNSSNICSFQASHNSGKKWSQFSSIVVQGIIEKYFKYSIDKSTVIIGNNSINFKFEKNKSLF